MIYRKYFIKVQILFVFILFVPSFASNVLMGGMSSQNNNFWLPISGAQDTYFGYSAISKGISGYIPELKHGNGWIKIGIRLTKWLVIDENFAQFTAVVEHEVFGHGFQSIDAGNSFFVFIDYPLYFPEFSGVTYTIGSDTALPKKPEFYRLASLDLTAGGINSNILTQRVIITDNIRKSVFTVYDANYYLSNVMSGDVYIITALLQKGDGDAYRYLQYNSSPQKLVLLPEGPANHPTYSTSNIDIVYDVPKDVKNRLIIYSSVSMLLDPVLWKTFASIFQYVRTGQEEYTLPYWTSWKITPEIDVTLAPYGPELNYTIYMDTLYVQSVTLRHSDGMFGPLAVGMDISTSDYHIIKKFQPIFISLSGSLWMQPQLSVKAVLRPVIKVKDANKWRDDTNDTNNIIPFGSAYLGESQWKGHEFGGALGITLGYQVNKKLAILLTGQEKSKGFLLGSSDEQETRVLLGLRFD